MGLLAQIAEATSEKVIDKMVGKVEEKLPPIAESVSREIRAEITQTWFGGWANGGAKTIAATMHEASITGRGPRFVQCSVESWTDSGAYAEPPRARRYVNANSFRYPMTYEPSDYVLHNFYDLGQIGLPAAESSTGTGWPNGTQWYYSNGTPTYWGFRMGPLIIQSPLSATVQTSPLWQMFVPDVLSQL